MIKLHLGLIDASIRKNSFAFTLIALGEINKINFSFDLINTTFINNFDFVSCVEERIAQSWTGVTVTHPYKTAHTDLKAFDTDYTGFVAAWHTVVGDRKPGKVAMAGSGGVSSAIAIAIIKSGAEKLAIWNLESERAQEIARIADPTCKRALAIPIEESCLFINSTNGLVNATVLGIIQYPGMALEQEKIGTQDWAFDAVNTPTWTNFLSTTIDKGLEYLTGFNLFKHLAISTFQTYTSVHIELSDADKVIDPLIDGL